jgi:AraC-like DNA-binding protein
MCHKILIISPSEESQELLASKVSSNFQTYTTGEWIDAIALIRSRRIQLIICAASDDPGPGYQLCRQFKANNISGHIPIILITTGNNLNVGLKALEAGADVHIGGILFREYLDAQIRNLITNRLKVREHFAGPVKIDEVKPEAEGKEHIMRKLTSCLFTDAPNSEIGVDQLAKLMHMSRPTLYRKIKHITNLTPNEIINEARLRKAAELLAETDLKVSDVARMVGYGSASSFGKLFLKQFKVTPATYQRMKKLMDAA